MQIDAQAQEVFRDGESLQKFLDFMGGQYNMPAVPNLLLLYSQNPELHLVRSREEWRRENRYPQPDAKSYTYIIQTEYEKDGVTRQGYTVGKGYDVSETAGKPLEDRPKQTIQTLLGAVLKIRMSVCRSRNRSRRECRPSTSQAEDHLYPQRYSGGDNLPCSEP